MGNNLRDQLLRAGLASKKEFNRSKQDQYRKQKEQRHQKTVQEEESKQLAKKKLAEKAERNRLLNRQRQEEANRKAVAAQIGQMIEAARLPTGDGALTYNFADGTKIKKLYVSKDIRDQLGKGHLAIVRHKERYEVVPAEVAEKIRCRDAGAIILKNEPKTTPAADDPYAEFPIPDDLEW